MTDDPLTCTDVSYTYRTDDNSVAALSDVTKAFPAGAVTTIAGPSGSGKSTLLRLLACVTRPDSGSIAVEGLEAVQLSPRDRRRLRRYRLAYVFQSPTANLVDYLTAAEQVRLAGDVRGVRQTQQQVHEVLATLRIDHRADHRPAELSGGEQQRLAVACAVVGSPAVVLADEPTAELDARSAHTVLDALHDLRRLGVAFAVTSHDPRVIEASDHVLRLDHGTVVESS